MGVLTKTFVFILCFNIAITLIGVNIAQDNVISRFFNLGSDSMSITGVNSDFNSSLPKSVQEGTSAGTATFGFLDGLKMAVVFILYLFGFGFTPIYWFGVMGVPAFITFTIGVPLCLMYYLGLIIFLRGGQA